MGGHHFVIHSPEGGQQACVLPLAMCAQGCMKVLVLVCGMRALIGRTPGAGGDAGSPWLAPVCRSESHVEVSPRDTLGRKEPGSLLKAAPGQGRFRGPDRTACSHRAGGQLRLMWCVCSAEWGVTGWKGGYI